MRKGFALCSALLLTVMLAVPAYADVWVPVEEQSDNQKWLWLGALALLAVITILLVIKYKRGK